MVKCIKKGAINMWKDIRDKAGNHYLKVHEVENVIVLAKMVDAEEANRLNINNENAEKIDPPIYVEDLAKEHRIIYLHELNEKIQRMAKENKK
jgi:hypothetical protein